MSNTNGTTPQGRKKGGIMNIGKTCWDAIRQFPQFGVRLESSNLAWEELNALEQDIQTKIGEAVRDGGGEAGAKAFQDKCLATPELAPIMKLCLLLGNDYKKDYEVNREAWDAVEKACGYNAPNTEATPLGEVVYKVFRTNALETLDAPEVILDLVFPENFKDLPEELQVIMNNCARVADETDSVIATYEQYRATIKNGQNLPKFEDLDENNKGETSPAMWADIVDAVYDRFPECSYEVRPA